MKVKQEETNEELSQSANEEQCLHYREMVSLFVNSKPKIKSINLLYKTLEDGETVKTGYVSFVLFMDSIGFKKKEFITYEREFFTGFVADFL